ncbi:MAG: RNA methyltransferase [Lentisphaeria bacterium]|nr:RNA methyltransferase [Lentisphaeria bacterium]
MSATATEYLYGVNPAFEAILANRRRAHRLLLNQGSRGNPRLRRLAELATARSIPVHWHERGRLIDLCGSRENQGAVLETDPYPYAALNALLAEPRLVLLDNIEDPHNVGAIIRSAEVLGYGGVLLPNRGAPPVLPSVVKASAGATEHIGIARENSANRYATIAAEHGFAVVALDAKGQHTFAEVLGSLPGKLLLVCGGEDAGVSRFILNAASCVVRIPQRGRVGSLNASVAAAIALHALMPAASP